MATISSVHFIKPYQESEHQLLENHNFKKGFDGWTIDQSQYTETALHNNEAWLSASRQNESVWMWQSIKTDLKPGIMLKLEGTLKSKDIVPGKQPWDKARLLLGQLKGGHVRWSLPHGVASLSGTNEWKKFYKTFTIVPGVDEVRVFAELGKCSGSFMIKDLSLKKVTHTHSYQLAQKICFIVWGSYILFLMYACLLNGQKKMPKVILLLSFIFIVAATSIPGQIKTQANQTLNHEIQEYILKFTNHLQVSKPDSAEHPTSDFTKIGHFLSFGILGLVLSLILPGANFRFAFLYLALLAGATEFIQFYIEDRGASFLDFLIDCTGGFLSIWIFHILYQSNLKQNFNP